MTPMMWVSFAAACMALVVGLITIYNFGRQKGQAKVEEGKKQEKFDQIMRDLRAAWDEIRILKGCTASSDKTLAEIQVTLKHIQDSLNRVEAKLDRHLEAPDA